MGYAHSHSMVTLTKMLNEKYLRKIKRIIINHYLLLPYLPLKNKENKIVKEGETPQK